jgi:hypothetical protein
MIIWEKYVKKYVWDDDKTPYFIAVSDLKQDQAGKEIFLYCFFLAIPTALIVAVIVNALSSGDFSNVTLGLFAASILAGAAYLNIRKNTSAAFFLISAPIVILIHFAVNGFGVPDLNFNKAEIISVDADADTLTLPEKKRWSTGHRMVFLSNSTLPAPLSSSDTYYLIQKDETAYQLAGSPDEAKSGTAIDLTDIGNGPHVLQRIIKLHFVEQVGMIIIVLLWLRYAFRIIAITKAYAGLPARNMNPWTRLPPGDDLPRK